MIKHQEGIEVLERRRAEGAVHGDPRTLGNGLSWNYQSYRTIHHVALLLFEPQ
jgi:hypothetical protein